MINIQIIFLSKIQVYKENEVVLQKQLFLITLNESKFYIQDTSIKKIA